MGPRIITTTPGSGAVVPLVWAVALVNVASIYLAQPLLPFIGDDFDAGTGAMAAVHAALQVAFGVGLVTFGIMADVVERRRLLMAMGSGLAVAAAVAAAAPGYPVFLLASLAMGVAAAVLPVLVGVATGAASARALVALLSAAPTGVVLGRVLAGLLGAVSWRAAFALSAVGAALSVVAIRRLLPASPPVGTPDGPRRAVAQMLALARDRANVLLNVSNAIVFLGWSAVWTILAFLLEDPPYDFGALQVGLVALVGVGGVAAGQIGDRLARALGEARAARLSILVTLAAALVLAASADVLVLLLVGLFVHNAAIWILQAVNIPATARRAGPERASRGTALLYLLNFVCTGAGAVLGAVVWDAVGWVGVGLLAAGACVASLALDVLGRALAPGPAARGSAEGRAG